MATVDLRGLKFGRFKTFTKVRHWSNDKNSESGTADRTLIRMVGLVVV
jgi:hypothetical protein